MKKRMRLRLFPVVALVAGLALVTRAGDILMGHWDSGNGNDVRVAMAVEEVDEKPPPMPDEKDAAMAMDGSGDEGLSGEEMLERDAAIGSDKDRFEDIMLEPAGTDYTREEVEILQALSKRRDVLNAREAELDQKEALIMAAQKNVERKIEELNQLKAEIEDLLAEQQKVQENRLQSLVKVYENMKSADAARIFNSMDLEILLVVIGRMSERKMAPILAEMDPERARIITIRLAEQRQLPPALKDKERAVFP